MAKQIGVVLYVVALIAVVVSVDILFLRHHFAERLIANVGIVLVFAAFGSLIFRGLGRKQEYSCRRRCARMTADEYVRQDPSS